MDRSEKMPNYYQIMFYNFYKLQIYTSLGTRVTPFNGVIALSVFMLLNFMSIFFFLVSITGVGKFIFGGRINPLVGIIPVILILFFNYYFLVAKGKFLHLEKMMKDQSVENKRQGKIITILYVMVTMLFFISSAMYLYYAGRIIANQ
jgi:hypothetical protein